MLQFDSPENLLRNPRPGFVSNMVGGLDRSLRLLTLSQVGDIMSTNLSNSTGLPLISADTNLRDAVSMHIWEGVHNLAVANADGHVIGTVSLEDILKRGAKL